MMIRFTIFLSAIALIAGCATGSGHLSREMRKDQYNRYAGEPVRRVNVIHLHSWTNIDRDQVVIWTSARKAYLVDLFSPCLSLDRSPRGIGISNFGNTLYAGSDAIIVGGERCMIGQIRPIDTKALKAERRGSQQTASLQERKEA